MNSEVIRIGSTKYSDYSGWIKVVVPHCDFSKVGDIINLQRYQKPMNGLISDDRKDFKITRIVVNYKCNYYRIENWFIKTIDKSDAEICFSSYDVSVNLGCYVAAK